MSSSDFKSKIDLFVRQDPEGKLNIEQELKYYREKLSAELPFFDELTEPRQIGLIGIASHIGVNDFLNFTRLLLALQARDYTRAGYELLNAEWPEKIGDVIKNIAETIISGIFPDHECANKE